jgi:hypothetical protein
LPEWTPAAFQQRFLIFSGFFPMMPPALPIWNACAGLMGSHVCKKLDEPYRFAKRTSVVLRCRACHVNTSLTATTVMQSSRMPLSVWFWGAYLVTAQTPGQSALQFQRQLGLKRYETAFQMLHKLRAGLVRPERDAIVAATGLTRLRDWQRTG